MFISVLLHGNEHTSWQALRALLKEYQDRELPRALSIFIGNVDAAKLKIRHLDEGLDFNRIWGTREQAPAPLMQQAIDEMQQRGVFLSVDIHNNTGKNPHYACVNRLEQNFLYLASLFSHNVVYFLKPEGVQSMAFSNLCPAVTVECGVSGEKSGTAHALDFLKACLHLENFPTEALSNNALSVYHTVAIVKINPDFEFSFGENIEGKPRHIHLVRYLEHANFAELHQGKILGVVHEDIDRPLLILNERGEDVSEDYIDIHNHLITLKCKVIPAMFTLNADNIRKDCLCYFMETFPLDQAGTPE